MIEYRFEQMPSMIDALAIGSSPSPAETAAWLYAHLIALTENEETYRTERSKLNAVLKEEFTKYTWEK